MTDPRLPYQSQNPIQHHPSWRDSSQEPSKGKAKLAFVLSVIPLGITWLVAIVMAIQVLRRPRNDGQDYGRDIAWAALAIAVLMPAVVVVAVLAFVFRDVFDEYDQNRLGSRDAADLRVGQCISNDLSDRDSVRRLNIVSCEGEHNYEVFANFDIETPRYPGVENAIRLADGGCGFRFADYVGAAWGESELWFYVLYPEAHNWRTGDRMVSCLLYHPDGPLTGSSRDSGR